MTASASLYFDKRHPKKDGTCPIQIQVYFRGEQKYYSTRISQHENEYNLPDTPKDRTKRAKDLREIKETLADSLNKAKQIIKDLGDDFSFKAFKRKFSMKGGDQNNLFYLLAQRARNLKETGQVSTAVTYENACASLQVYYGKEKLPLNVVDAIFLQKYKGHMQELGRSDTTIGIYLRTVRKIFNDAISEGIIHVQKYPFYTQKNNQGFIIPQGANVKKAIADEHLQKIFNYQPESDQEQWAKDFWVFSFLGNGMNPKDIALLKYSNIHDDFIVFRREKTKNSDTKVIQIKTYLDEHKRRIIKRWGTKPALPETYIFGIFAKGDSAESKYKKNQLFVKSINKYMNRIAKTLQITFKVNTYEARHTFSTKMVRSNKSVFEISEALGHSNIKTTQAYLAGFEDETKKGYSDLLTNFGNPKGE